MKKIVLIIAIALLAVTSAVQAQTITINKVDGTKLTYQASEITSIEFNPAETAAQKAAGTYTGDDSLSIASTWNYKSGTCQYNITANEDGTINVIVPDQKFTGTVVGDIEQGIFTISNIAFDESRNAFYRDYSGDGLKAHVKMVSNGQTTRDADFQLNKANITITVSEDAKTVTIVNNYTFGNMPMMMTGTFVGTK